MGLSKGGFKEAIAVAEKSEIALVVIGGKSGLSGMGEGDHGEELVDFSESAFADLN